jgi:hypothetical protein
MFRILIINRIFFNTSKKYIKMLVVIFFQFIIFAPQILAETSKPGYNYYCFTKKIQSKNKY